MPAPYGITATGLNVPTFEEIEAEFQDALRTAFGIQDFSARTVEGILIKVLTEHLKKIWELVEILYNSMDPDAAFGVLLEMLALLTSTLRRAAKSSQVTMVLTGDPGTVVNAGSRIAVEDTGDEFETQSQVTFIAVDAWAATTAYDEGDEVTNSSRVYRCITSGVSAGSGGPTTTSTDITDGTAHWAYLGEGTGGEEVIALSVEQGPILALSRTLTQIVTPVAGWLTAVNVLDADLGKLVDSDEELRLRRELDLTRAATGTADGIRSAVAAVDGVTSVRVYANNTDETLLDVDGDPEQTPHSVEVVVRGGDDQDILDAMFKSIGAGIQTYSNSIGTVTGTVTDSEGEEHELKFTRPAELEVYLEVSLEKDPLTYPTDGDDAVKLAIVTWGDAFLVGSDVRPTAVAARCFDVDGVLEVTEVLMLEASPPGPSDNEKIIANKREIAVFDTSRIIINSVDGTV